MKTVKTIGLVLFLLFLTTSFVKNLIDYNSKKAFYENYRTKYETEKKRNIELKTALLKKSDLGEIEKIIRNKLGLLRPDEVAVVMPRPTPSPVIITLTPAPSWRQWLKVYVH